MGLARPFHVPCSSAALVPAPTPCPPLLSVPPFPRLFSAIRQIRDPTRHGLVGSRRGVRRDASCACACPAHGCPAVLTRPSLSGQNTPPPWSTAQATAPSPGRPTPEVVKQDKSSGGSVDTTKTRSGPQRVRRSSGERPIGAAKGKQSDAEALCQPPPPLGGLGGGWGQRLKTSVCTRNRPQISSPFDNKFHVLPEEHFSDAVGGVGRPGLAPNPPPPSQGSSSNGLAPIHSWEPSPSRPHREGKATQT